MKAVLAVASLALIACQGPRQWAEPIDGGSTGATEGRDMSAGLPDMASGGAAGEAGSSMDGSTAGDVPPPPPPAANQRRLTVLVTGPGEILVDEQPLPCPGTCVVDRPPGTPVTVATRPGKTAAGPISMFLGWSGACTGKGGCVVTLDDHKMVKATFHRFLAWEETVTRTGTTPPLRLSPVGQDLYVSGECYGTCTVTDRSFTSAGSFDGIVMRYAADGRALWAKAVAGPAGDYAGLVVPGAAPTELRLSAWVGGTAAGSFGMQTIGAGGQHLFLNPAGDVLRFLPTQADSPYSPIQGPFEPSRYQGGFTVLDINDNRNNLQLFDEMGRMLWSKSIEGAANWLSARVCDSSGSVVALIPFVSTVTVAGATFDQASGNTLLVKASRQGEFVWATAFKVRWTTTSPRPTVFCDPAGDVYVTATFTDELKFGDRSARTMDADTDVAVVKVRGVTPQVLWLTTFGSKYEDASGAWGVESSGKVLITARFVGDVTIAGEIFPETVPPAGVLIRIDPATGTALSAFRHERDIRVLLPHPTAGAYFAGISGFGQLVSPP
jgi:hypothetical protein